MQHHLLFQFYKHKGHYINLCIYVNQVSVRDQDINVKCTKPNNFLDLNTSGLSRHKGVSVALF